MSRKPRVLLVDADADSRTVYRAILQYFDYDVLEAHDGPDALQLALSDMPDVVVTELTLPRLSGLDLVRELRGHENTCNTHIVVLTAVSFDSEMHRASEAGCHLFLSKPVEPLTLVHQIQHLLESTVKS